MNKIIRTALIALVALVCIASTASADMFVGNCGDCEISYGREGFYGADHGCTLAEGLVGHVGDCQIYYGSSKGLYSPSPGCEWVEKAAKSRRLSKKRDPASAKALDSVSGRLQPHDDSSPPDGSTDFVSQNPLDEQSHGVHTLSTVFDNGPYADYNKSVVDNGPWINCDGILSGDIHRNGLQPAF